MENALGARNAMSTSVDVQLDNLNCGGINE